jgi:hypothetical protein
LVAEKEPNPHLAREAMDPAYLEAARQVGHARPQISGAYLGSRAGVGPSDRPEVGLSTPNKTS